MAERAETSESLPVASTIDSQTNAPTGAEPASASVSTQVIAPTRPVWNIEEPSAPWCPPEWRALLESRVPTLPAMADGASARESLILTSDHGPWRSVGASRRGRLHAHRAEHREDALQMASWPNGWCLTVADGAGSSRWSRLGATMATTVLTQQLAMAGALPVSADAAATLRVRVADALRAVLDAMRTFAEDVGEPGRAFRTTLLAVVVHGAHGVMLQIGDGALFLRRTDGTLWHPYGPSVGEYSGEVAHFLPDDGAFEAGLASLQLFDASAIDLAVLCTDGVEDPWYPLARHADALVAEWTHGIRPESMPGPVGYVPAGAPTVIRRDGSAEQAGTALAEWLAFEKRGENDDRTVALAWRRQP